MVALGYGKFVRARDVIALIPIEDDERGDGRRTYVHVAGLADPIVASRTERAILADMESAANLAPGRRTHLAEPDAVSGARSAWRRARRGRSAAGRRGREQAIGAA
jgi:hypothetical protein